MAAADGTWNVTINSPMGAQKGTLTVVTSGDTFTGSFASPMGAQDVSGKADGDKLTWVSEITSPMPMKLEFEATAAGDNLTGNVKLGAFGSAPLTGTRA